MWPGKATCARDRTRHATVRGARRAASPSSPSRLLPTSPALLPPFSLLSLAHRPLPARLRHRKLPLPALPSPTTLPQPPSPPLLSLSSLSFSSLSPNAVDVAAVPRSGLPSSPTQPHFPFLSSPMASSPHHRLPPLFPCHLCSPVLQPWGSTVSPKSRPSPPCFLSLTFAVDFVRQHRRRLLRLLHSLSWPPLLILAATGVFPSLSIFFPPALLPLPYPSITEPRRRPGSSSLPSWPTTSRLLLSPSSPSLPPVTSPASSPSALIPQRPASVAERHRRLLLPPDPTVNPPLLFIDSVG